MIEIESKEIGNPFPGLRPFETHEYELFFGREGQSDALISRLQRANFLAVVGTSGSGKSSLVRAGLLPALRGGMMAGAGSGWRISIMRPGSDPIGNLAIALAHEDVLLNAGGGLPAAEAQAVIEATLRRGALGLVEVARLARLAEHEKLLIVVDQFEELFRFRAARPASTSDDASAFVKLLLEASQQSELSIYVVPTMRSDFLGDCAQFQGLPEAINDGQYLIPRMTRDERRFAITGPVGVTRGKITEPLVNRLMNDVGDNPDQLPILQHALMRTWDYWAVHRSNGEPIDLKHYEAVGTMADALSKHADEAFNELPDERSRVIAEILFKALTERGADNREIRRPTRLKDICEIAGASVAEVSAVVEVFRGGGRSFLMPPADVVLKPETVIDISHESLIRNWDRLQEWVAEEAHSARIYRRLAEAAVLHRQGSEGLLQDPGLQTALEWRDESESNAAWAARYLPEFDAAMDYLEKSRVARDERSAAERDRERERRELEVTRVFAEQQARSARRLRWLTAGMAVMFLLSLAAAGYAMAESKRASAESKRANDEKDRAEQAANAARKASNEAKLAKDKADEERAKADELAKNLGEEKKKTDKALEAQKLATQRANEQTAIAAENLKKAEAAKRELDAALQRNELFRAGLEAFKREEFDQARLAFEKVTAELTSHQVTANVSTQQSKQYAEALGWTLSNLGATHLKQQNFEEAALSYETARGVLERVLPPDSDEPILFETYDGLAQSYHELHKKGGGNRSQEAFSKAEEFYRRALELKKRQMEVKSGPLAHRLSADVAAGYLKLARLYRDGGKLDDAEKNFKTVIELRRPAKDNTSPGRNERAPLVAALRELGEFYREQTGRFDQAIKVFNEMIVVQEDISIDELVDHSSEISNSYSDLSRLYTARGDPKRAQDAMRIANLLQRTSFKLRQMRKSQAPVEGANAVKELTTELDALGDAYAKLMKFADAEVFYQTALGYRETGQDQWKSYDKLASFYRDTKNLAKAEEYKNLLAATVKGNADVLMRLGAIHSDEPYDPKKPYEGEQYYRDALAIYQQKGDWEDENIILFRLSRLYLEQKRTAEREQSLRDRVDTLAKYFKQLEMKTEPQPKNPVSLVYQYLHALNALAFGNKNRDQAESFYERGLEKFDYIIGNVEDEKVLQFYLGTLDDYQRALNKPPADAGRAAKAAKVREKLPILRERVARAREKRKPDSEQSAPTAP